MTASNGTRNGGNGDHAARQVDVGLRRVAGLDPDAPLPASDPELAERLANEVRSDGPITFARFMARALYEPELGYYARPTATGPGREADFLTAPEGHGIFGWSIARHLEDVWTALDRPARFVVREHGAGTGALAAGVLDGLRRSRSELLDAIRYQPSDASEDRLFALAARLAGVGLDHRLEPAGDRPADGAILANELLDALPVHRVEGGANGELLESYVDVDGEGAFYGLLGPASTDALARRLDDEGIRLEPGQRAEVCLAVEPWLASATAPLERGSVLLIDYGHPAAELYSPARGSTLRAYHRHRVHADPFVAIGRQDLTAHVDLTAVERAAQAAGLQSIGRTTQARFLADLGAGDLLVALQSEPGTTLASYLEAKAALVRMLDPRATGAFAVLGFGRALEPKRAPEGRLRGFG